MNKAKINELYKAREYRDVREIINEAVNLYPNNIAFKIKEKDEKGNKIYKNITYLEMQKDINALGTSFIDVGLKNEKIAIIGKNRYEWAISFFSAMNGTGVAVPLDKGLPEEEIELLCKRSRAKAIVFSKEYIDTFLKICKNKTTNLELFICMDEFEKEYSEEDKFGNQITSYKELIKNGNTLLKKGKKAFINAKINNDELAELVFTSGTTSSSKGVMLSHKNIASNISAMKKCEKIYPTDVNMAFLPFHHTFGSTGIIMFLSHGATNVFCDGLRHIQENLKEYKVSTFVCVPLLLEAMYKKIYREIEKKGKQKVVEKGIKISNVLLKVGIDIRRKLFKDIINSLGGNLRFIISGASAIDKKVAKGFNDFGILTIQGYGLTETAPVLCAENAKNIRYGSVGHPLSGVNVKIFEPNEEGIGEIIAKGDNVMLGYYEDTEATNKVLKDGWFYTGDLGKKDKDNYFFITGRQKNVIVLKNGKNIYPEEIEEIINKLPYVDESMVFGYPKDDDLIVSVKIVYNKDYVQANFGDISNEELHKKIWEDIKQINSGLTNYKHMKKLIITDEPMVKTSTAKIKRFIEIENIIKKGK